MRGRRHKLQVSTFPFLAVLLCAMGSLILVLLVMDRKAHQAAQARARREAARLAEENAHAMEARQAERQRFQQQAQADWEQKRHALHDKLTHEQIEMQLQMRKVREQLQEIAARLHYEQDTSTKLRRQVQNERDRLRAEERLLQTRNTRCQQAAKQSKQSSQTLRRMTLDLLRMEQVLKDLKAARKRQQKTFSVVPYHGRRGENRRPLYVECIADKVIFHPQRKPMPLASYLPDSDDAARDVRAEVKRRIARQRQKLAGLPANADTTPYLLLLLRPSGVRTYYEFQAALKGMSLDFGYEFIDDDWILDFPDDDEAPKAQPWMFATKSPSPSTPAAAAAASSSPRTNAHPIALAPRGDPRGASVGGIRGFRTGKTGGTGNRMSGARTGGVAGGTGPSMPRGVGTSGVPFPGFSGSQAELGIPVREALLRPSRPVSGGTAKQSFAAVRSQAELGNEGTGNEGTGNEGTGNQGTGTQRNWSVPRASARGQGGRVADARGSGSVHGGGGRGHPAALRPSFREGGGGMGIVGNGGPPGDGFRGAGAFGQRGGSTGQAPGRAGWNARGGSALRGAERFGQSSSAMGGSPGAGGSDLPGLGPPRALSSGSAREGYGGSGTGPRGMAAAGSSRNGMPNPGAASVAAGGPRAGQTSPPGGPPGATNAGTHRNARPNPGAQATPGMSPSANGGRSSDVVIFVDPVTGKPTTPPHPKNPPDENSTEEHPPETDAKRRKRRVRVVAGNSGGGNGAPQVEPMDRFGPVPAAVSPRRKPALRPAWVHGGRAWTIYIECRADTLVLYPSQRTFPLAAVVNDPNGNPLIQAIQKMIDRRQSRRRRGEPPYHPKLCLLVRPEYVRTFLTVYPALDALPVPKTRRNLDAGDNVFDIVTGAVP